MALSVYNWDIEYYYDPTTYTDCTGGDVLTVNGEKYCSNTWPGPAGEITDSLSWSSDGSSNSMSWGNSGFKICTAPSAWPTPTPSPSPMPSPYPYPGQWDDWTVTGDCVVHGPCVCSSNFVGSACNGDGYPLTPMNGRRLNHDGMVTNPMGAYQNGEACQVQFHQPMALSVYNWDIEYYYDPTTYTDCTGGDVLTVNGEKYCSNTWPGPAG